MHNIPIVTYADHASDAGVTTLRRRIWHAWHIQNRL